MIRCAGRSTDWLVGRLASCLVGSICGSFRPSTPPPPHRLHPLHPTTPPIAGPRPSSRARRRHPTMRRRRSGRASPPHVRTAVAYVFVGLGRTHNPPRPHTHNTQIQPAPETQCPRSQEQYGAEEEPGARNGLPRPRARPGPDRLEPLPAARGRQGTCDRVFVFFKCGYVSSGRSIEVGMSENGSTPSRSQSAVPTYVS